MEEQRPEGTAQPRVRRDARANRARLLAAAKELFAEQGVEATTMQEIARAAGVGQGTLYRHFADKGELCLALIKEDVAAFQERVGAVIALRADANAIDGAWALASPLERLDMLIVEKVRLTESHLPLFEAMDAAGARRPKPFRGPFHTWLHARIVALLEEAATVGEVAELDATIVADVILAATAPPLYAFQRHDQGYSQERVLAATRRLFMDALRRTPA
jgi:AcrR family transcriptional regulator